MSESPARRSVRQRLSLLVVIPLLVVATGAITVARSFLGARATVQALSADLFREVSRQTVVSTRTELRRAVPVSETVRLLLGNPEMRADRRALARALVDVLRVNSELSWVSYSDKDGSFTGAMRTESGDPQVNLSTIAGGKTELFEYAVDEEGNWKEQRHVADSGYDPRTRPFWKLAAQRRRRVWAPPYIFFEQAVQGISCATPYLVKDELAGVISVDFGLNSLSKMVASQRISERGRVFVYAPDGTVIAHPSVRLGMHAGHAAEGTLMTMTTIDDPAARAYFEAVNAEHVGAEESEAPSDLTRVFRFELGGQTYLGSHTSFAIDENLRWVAGAYAPESDFMQIVRDSSVTSLIVSGVAVALTLLLSFVLIARPLSRLAAEMDEVGNFELGDQPLAGSVFREIAQMSDSLRRMKRGLRSFASYVPRDLVRAVLASGQEAVLGGKTRELTVLFSDIAGFTTFAETAQPAELVAMLGDYLDEMTRILEAHGATVDKYLGDGIMAFWGAPVDMPDHAERAALAALACHRRLAELAAEGKRPWAVSFRTRIGVASGDVLVGNIGTPTRMNYTVMGDTANLASRLEGLNKVYGTQVLLSESNYLAAEHRVVARPIDLAAVKGKAQGTKVFEVLCLTTDADPVSRALAAACARALDAYLARDFAAAVAGWEEALTHRPGDGAAQVMLDRARAFLAAPPPPEWSGVYVVQTK